MIIHHNSLLKSFLRLHLQSMFCEIKPIILEVSIRHFNLVIVDRSNTRTGFLICSVNNQIFDDLIDLFKLAYNDDPPPAAIWWGWRGPGILHLGFFNNQLYIFCLEINSLFNSFRLKSRKKELQKDFKVLQTIG